MLKLLNVSLSVSTNIYFEHVDRQIVDYKVKSPSARKNKTARDELDERQKYDNGCEPDLSTDGHSLN